MQKCFAPILILLGIFLAAAIAGGAYYLGTRKPANVTPSPSSNPNETANPDSIGANWKTYTNSKRGYEFKYPDLYKLREIQASTSEFEGVYLEKETTYTICEGFGGQDALKDGVSTSFFIIPNKNLSETELKSEYGSDITIKKVTLAGKYAIEVLLPLSTDSRRLIYYAYNAGTVLAIDSYAGFETTSDKKKEYLNDF